MGFEGHSRLSRSGKTVFEVAQLACQQAGEILLSYFHNLKGMKYKGKRDIQTEADLASEKAITDILTSEFPQDGIVSEESAAREGFSGYNWVVDPLDGTNNFYYGLPYFAVNIALARGDDVLLGLTYAPVQKEMFRAEEGKGAFLNDVPIHVSAAEKLKNCLVSFDMGYSEEQGQGMLEIAKQLWPEVHSIRLLGSGALGLAYAACGRVGLYFHRYLFPWDVASGILLVREAGGVVEAWGRQPIKLDSGSVVAASSALSEQFHEILSRIQYLSR